MDAYIQHRLRQLRASGVKEVKARASGRADECEHCKALDGVIFAIQDFPEYPPRGCSCPTGCGCVVARVLPEDRLVSNADLVSVRD